MINSKSFGRIVRDKSKYHGVGFCDLASRAKVSKGTLSKVWNGKGNPTMKVMARIAKELFFDIDHDQ